MVDLNKDEYACVMIMHTQDAEKHNLDTNVVLFKTANDVKRAILNVITNNIKNYQDDIVHMYYDSIGTISDKSFGFVKIVYKNGTTKVYDTIRRKIQEVK